MWERCPCVKITYIYYSNNDKYINIKNLYLELNYDLGVILFYLFFFFCIFIILRRNCLLKHVIEGRINVKKKQGRSRKQLLDDFN